MKTLTAKEAKYAFGRLIDLARVGPVAVAKHGRPVVVVMATEEFERLKAIDKPAPKHRKTASGDTNGADAVERRDGGGPSQPRSSGNQ